jgi:hypothetical protein
MIKRNLYKRVERLEALALPASRGPEFLTIEFVCAETGEVTGSRVIELYNRRLGSKPTEGLLRADADVAGATR